MTKTPKSQQCRVDFNFTKEKKNSMAQNENTTYAKHENHVTVTKNFNDALMKHNYGHTCNKTCT